MAKKNSTSTSSVTEATIKLDAPKPNYGFKFVVVEGDFPAEIKEVEAYGKNAKEALALAEAQIAKDFVGAKITYTGSIKKLN